MSETNEREMIRERKRQELLNQLETASASTDQTQSTQRKEPIQVKSTDHFTELTQNDVVLVDFYADWCGPCQMLEPIVAEVAAKSSAMVAKVDIDRHQSIAQKLGIRSVPTLMIYVSGDPVKRLVGMQDQGTLLSLIQKYSSDDV